MNTIINLNYRGNSVPVKMVDGEPWVNLNAIGRPFGKEPNQWLKSAPTKEYIEAVVLLDNKQTDSDPSGEIEPKKARVRIITLAKLGQKRHFLYKMAEKIQEHGHRKWWHWILLDGAIRPSLYGATNN